MVLLDPDRVFVGEGEREGCLVVLGVALALGMDVGVGRVSCTTRLMPGRGADRFWASTMSTDGTWITKSPRKAGWMPTSAVSIHRWSETFTTMASRVWGLLTATLRWGGVGGAALGSHAHTTTAVTWDPLWAEGTRAVGRGR